MQLRLGFMRFKGLFGRLVMSGVLDCCAWPEASAAVEEAGSLVLAALGGLFVPSTREEKQP
jgi:hypothetical protein